MSMMGPLRCRAIPSYGVRRSKQNPSLPAVRSGNPAPVGRQQSLPPLAMAAHENRVGKTVAGHMLRRHAFPAMMLDGHAGFPAQRLEAHLDPGLLAGREGGLPPGEGEACPRLPGRDATDLEDLAGGSRLCEAAAFAFLEGETTRWTTREAEQPVGLPPEADLAGEHPEGMIWRRAHAQ